MRVRVAKPEFLRLPFPVFDVDFFVGNIDIATQNDRAVLRPPVGQDWRDVV